MLRPTNKRPRQDQVYSTDVQNRLYYGNKSVKTLYKTITTHCVTPGRGYLKSQVLVNIHLIEGTITKPQQKESEGGVVTLAFPSFPIVRHDSTHRRKPAPRVMASKHLRTFERTSINARAYIRNRLFHSLYLKRPILWLSAKVFIVVSNSTA